MTSIRKFIKVNGKYQPLNVKAERNLEPGVLYDIIGLSTQLITLVSEFLGLFSKKVPTNIYNGDTTYGLLIYHVTTELVKVSYQSAAGESIYVFTSPTEKQAKVKMYNHLKNLGLV